MSFNSGTQFFTNKADEFYALAVRDGDVAVVPIPAAAWLFGGALGALGMLRRKALA